ncbi:MAG: CopG family transcriptional regulator [Acidobacteria bacterium]|nr:CopG family transcriptional regulator [Acidobacteriota bacterium]
MNVVHHANNSTAGDFKALKGWGAAKSAASRTGPATLVSLNCQGERDDDCRQARMWADRDDIPDGVTYEDRIRQPRS